MATSVLPAALYAGSFDPPHLGHLDLIERAAALVPRLVVAVAVNPDKPGAWPTARRIEVLAACCAHLSSVEIVAVSGALAPFARARGIRLLIRGLRGPADWDGEAPMAWINGQHGCETLFLAARPEHALLSSRAVRAARAAGLPVDGLVPPAVATALD